MINSLVDFSKTSVARGGFKITLSLLSISSIFYTNEQTYAAPEPDSAGALLPLEVGQLSARQPSAELGVAAENINAAFAKSQSPESEPEVLLPIVGELLNEKGKFDWGMDIPVTFDFGDLAGNSVLVVGTDFKVD